MQKNGKMDLVLGGKGISMSSTSIDDLTKQKAVEAFNKEASLTQKAITEKYEKELEEGRKTKARMDTLEIVPSGMYILCKPYQKNPYECIEEKGGLIIPTYDGHFKNPDTGEEDVEEELTRIASVIEVGPLCKFVKPGDDIYYRKMQGIPVPFFRQGMEVVAETQIQVIINEGLKERFKNINND